MTQCIKTFNYGKHTVTLETGVIARQSTGAVIIDVDGTTVLVTVVGIEHDQVAGREFFPLRVDYTERSYAAGKIPGGYFKREGRPSEAETLVARLIDRPIRPMFPEGFMNEVQVVATVMSHNPEVHPDVPAMIGAFAALAISGIPMLGVMGAARVGYANGEFILNPTTEEMQTSELDLIVAGTKNSVLMVESEAKQLSEKIMLEAVMFGHDQMQIVIKAIEALASEAGKPTWDWQPPVAHTVLQERLTQDATAAIQDAYLISNKRERQATLKKIRKDWVHKFQEEAAPYTESAVLGVISSIEELVVRGRILAGESRIDGRDTVTVRPITTQAGVLPRTHGSAFFTRGETQAIVVATLGTGRDAQVMDTLNGEKKETFMLHYNFPPYSVGEVGMIGSPKRREIGHGRLAWRAVHPVLPNAKEFPYVTRVVSEITESNGSSSMASVCGASLALMDAGVPLKAPVAGIAMGLIKEGDKFAVLSDILGDEDHLGDMDFKVAGTQEGITALQMDIKIDGITRDIMEVALHQAQQGRLHILNIMNQTLNAPRTELSEFAPRFYSMKVNPDKIRDVIGKGGATIRSLTEETGTSIEVNDDGTINIVASDQDAGERARLRIESLTAEVEVNKIYEGKVVRIVDFGAFVTVIPGKDGLVHISQISNERINDINSVLTIGQMVKVKVLEIDRQGRIRLSMKEADDSIKLPPQDEVQDDQASQETQESSETSQSETISHM